MAVRCAYGVFYRPFSLGVSIQEEQEVVSIIVPREIKKKVMREISEKCGCRTPAKGIILSLPVDEIIGLS